MENQVVIFSYYSPEELTGIGKYNGETIEWLVNKGCKVTSFSNAPFYPYWKKYSQFKNPIYSKRKGNYTDIRSWVYIPANPSAFKKIVSELSFFLSSLFALIVNIRTLIHSKLILVILPPYFLGIVPLLIGKLFRTKVLFHLQDLQVDAAKELKLLPKSLFYFLETTEKWLLRKTDYISTISQGMLLKITEKEVPQSIMMLPNWSDLEAIYPTEPSHWLHDYLNLDRSKKLVVYSGNVGEKQGLENLIFAAKSLAEYSDLHFVILGEGLYKEKLNAFSVENSLQNFTLGSLVPKENLNEMLNSSFIQLVIQKGESTESFLPSKLTNILASGSPCIVTANKGTSLYSILEEAGIQTLIEPDDPKKLMQVILNLYTDESLRNRTGKLGRKWAKKNLAIDECLHPLEQLIQSL